MDVLLTLVALGAAAGILAGLLGIGGGLIVVPGLAWWLEQQGASPSVTMKCAIGTSLAVMIFTSLSSVRAHHRRGAVRWPLVWQLLPGLIGGALLAPAVAHYLSGSLLRILFGIFLIVVAGQLARERAASTRRALPTPWPMRGWGALIGFVSSLFGVGGGTMSVPLLTWCGVSMVQAVATAATIGMPIALIGTIGYVVVGVNASSLPMWSVGYVVLPALIVLSVTTMLAAPLGARLAHRLPQRVLRKIFAGFLLVVAARLLLT